MANLPIPTTFKDVVRNPYTYLLITIVSLLWYFVYSFTDVTSKNDSTCFQEKTELRTELKEERKKNDDLINAILAKQGVIEKLTVITDSLNKKDDDK
jgi:hypothetical protein